jgi:hypothetical protein
VSLIASDFAGNALKSFSWSFGVEEFECGKAEFYGIETNSVAPTFIVNSLTQLSNGVLAVPAYNPAHKELSWIENTRIEAITLLYRKSGSSAWLTALDASGIPAEFFDDVSQR